LRRLKRRLDAVDLEILRILARDCNIEVTRLAKIIGLSVPSTRRRIRYLLSSGILKGCSATIDPEALGVYTVVIRFRGEGLEEILKGLDGNRSVERVYYSSNRGEGFIIARIPSVLDAEIIAEDMRKRGATSVEIFIVDNIAIERPWEPSERIRGIVTYKCRFCGAPIVGKPYIVRSGDTILIFTNRKCAEAYFALEHRGKMR